MLKERIGYLCEKNNISRKKLARGLITLPHLSNILLGRYNLAEDLTLAFSKRLDVEPEYIECSDQISEMDILKCEELIRRVILYKVEDRMVFEKLPERENSLALELVYNLVKACYYQYTNQKEKYQKLYQQYLFYYLNEFDDKALLSLPTFLQKAFYFFKVINHKYAKEDQHVLNYIVLLLELYKEETKIWLILKRIEVESYIDLRNFDPVLDIIKSMLVRIRREEEFNYLVSTYICESLYFSGIKMNETALKSLDQAEESMVQLGEESHQHFYEIYYNRVIINLKLNKLDDANKNFILLEEKIKKCGIEGYVIEHLEILRCDIFNKESNIKKLNENVDKLESLSNSIDIINYINYYRGMIALAVGETDNCKNYLLKCLSYFEEEKSRLRLIGIYRALADISKSTGKYKKTAEYLEKIIELSV